MSSRAEVFLGVLRPGIQLYNWAVFVQVRERRGSLERSEIDLEHARRVYAGVLRELWYAVNGAILQ